MDTACRGQTREGRPCGMTPQGNGWCYSHDPARADERAAARRRGGKHRKRLPPPDAAAVDLSSVEGIRAYLERAALDAARLDVGTQRIKAMTSIASTALAALDRAPRDDDNSNAHAVAMVGIFRAMIDADLGRGAETMPPDHLMPSRITPPPPEKRIIAYGRPADLVLMRERFAGENVTVNDRSVKHWAGEVEPCDAVAVMDGGGVIANAYRVAGIEVLSLDEQAVNRAN